MDGDEDCSIRVICRFRPVNKREIEEGGGLAKQLTFPTDKCVEVSSFNGRGPQTFNFDKIFYDPSTTQEDIYQLAARKSIDDVIKGYNSTIFAYGQTGAGKSFTMFGVISVPDLKGIIPRSCMHIFDHITKDTSGTEYTIKCSFLEIYKEIVRDLLNPSGSAGKQGLKVRESPGKGVWVEGLHEAYVTCEQDVFDLIQTGESHRAVSSTSMNASSSRSHSLFILTLHQKTRDGSTKEGRLNLADLAGSEKVGKTGATGDTLEEAKKINQSLSALGNCINALTKSKKTHVPYRDSKLTFILRESLGGNCKTTLLVACSPHIFNLEETISTLMFAKRAKTIKNSVKLNAQKSVAELMAIIEKLKKELAYFKKYIDILEKELEKVKGPNWKDDLPKISATPAASGGKKVLDDDEDEKFDDEEPSSASTSQPDLSEKSANSTEEKEESSSDEDEEEETKTEGSATPETSNNSTDSPKKEKKVKKPKKSKKSSKAKKDEEDEEIYRSSANMSVKLAELQVELQKLKEKSEYEIKDLTEENKGLTEQNNELEKKIKDKKNKVKETELELKKLKESVEDEKRSKEILEEKLTYEIQQLKLKNEEQENKISSVDAYNAQMKEKISAIETELEKNQSEFEIVQREKQKFAKENEEMNSKIHQQLQKIQEIQLKLSEIEQNNVNMKSEIQQKEHANKNLQQKIENLENHLKTQETQSGDVQSKLRVATSENLSLQAQINDLTFEIENLQSQIKEFQTRNVAELQEKVKEIENISIPIAQFEAVLKEKENYVHSFNQIQEKYKTERDFVIQLQNQIEELNFSHDNEKNQLKTHFEKEREELTEKLDFLQAKLEENQEIYLNKLKNFEEKCLNYSIDLEYEKSSRLVAEEKLEQELQESSNKNKEHRRLKTQLEDKDREIAQQQSLFTSQSRSLDAQASRFLFFLL